MNRELEIGRHGPHLDGERAFGNQLAGAGSHDADAKDTFGFRIDDELRQAIRPIERGRAA
jgi:hypothetical protein